MIRVPRWIGVVLALFAVSACRPPKYVRFVSPYRDYVCDVPWGWNVYLDSAGSDYTSATFTGPLEPDFYRGTPSFSIRWYAYNAPHSLLDSTREVYRSTTDFTRQMLSDVYYPDGYTKAASDFDQQLAASRGELTADWETVKVSNTPATHYIVYRTMIAPAGVNLGVVQDAKGNGVIRQRHGYVLVPLKTGFYVITYPATREGYEKYKKEFNALVNSFKLLKEGPAGPVTR